MNIRIENSKGIAKHTKVFLEDGTEITNHIKSMVIHIGDEGQVVTADIQMPWVSVDVLAKIGRVIADGKETVEIA